MRLPVMQSKLKKRQGQDADHREELDRARRYRALVLLAYQYVQAYDYPEDDLWYVNPIDIRAITPPKLPKGQSLISQV